MVFALYRIPLDIHKTISQAELAIKKDDSARQIEFYLTECGKPYEIAADCTATFRAKKPDGTILYNACEIEDNSIRYTLTNQTSASVGIVECEVTLYGSDSRQITSPRFTLRVEDNLYSDGEVESQDEFSQLAVLISKAEANLHPPYIDEITKNWMVWSVEDEDYVDTGINAEGEDGFSPEVTVVPISGGHQVTITDASGDHVFNVMDGQGGGGGDIVVVNAELTLDEEEGEWSVTADKTATEILALVEAGVQVQMLCRTDWAQDQSTLYTIYAYAGIADIDVEDIQGKDIQFCIYPDAIRSGELPSSIHCAITDEQGEHHEGIYADFQWSVAHRAEQAYTTAQNALTTANSARTTAQTAYEKAQTAQTKADVAFDVAYDAQPKTITDAGGHFAIKTVEGALSELGVLKVSPVAKTAAMTQAVGKDSSGRLWATPDGEVIVNATITLSETSGQRFWHINADKTPAETLALLKSGKSVKVLASFSNVPSVPKLIEYQFSNALYGSTGTGGIGYFCPSHDLMLTYGILPFPDSVGFQTGISGASDEWSAFESTSNLYTRIGEKQSASITDAGGYFPVDTVEAALQSLGAELAGINTLIGSGVIS